MEAELKAEVTSALALLDDLSAKSSDSGLSEETCWELFGGPCPEALRKKIGRLETREKKKDEEFFSAMDMLETQRDDTIEKKQASKETVEDLKAEHHLSKEITEDFNAEEQMSKETTAKQSIDEEKSGDEARLNEVILTPHQSKDANEAILLVEKGLQKSELTEDNPSIAEEVITKQSKDKREEDLSSVKLLYIENEAAMRQLSSETKEHKLAESVETTQERSVETKDGSKIFKESRISIESKAKSSIEVSKASFGFKELKSQSVAGIMKTPTPEVLVRAEYESVGREAEAVAEENMEVPGNTEEYELMNKKSESVTTNMEAQISIVPLKAESVVESLDKQTSKLPVRAEDYRLMNGKSESATANMNTQTPKMPVKTEDYKSMHRKSESSQTETLFRGSSGLPANHVGTTISPKKSPINTYQQTVLDRVSNMSTSISALLLPKAVKQKSESYILVAEDSTSTSEESVRPRPKIPNLGKAKKQCTCRCYVEHKIQESDSSCDGCSHYQTRSCKCYKNYKINIFDALEAGEDDGHHNSIKITSFTEDKEDVAPKPCCNKKLQTSTVNMYENTLYLNSIYPPVAKKHGYRDHKIQSRSDTSSNCVLEATTKKAPGLVDSLKNAFQKRDIVRGVVERFETEAMENRQAAEVCRCCSRPRRNMTQKSRCSSWQKY